MGLLNSNALNSIGLVLIFCTTLSFINKKEYQKWKKNRILDDEKEKKEIEKDL